MEIPLLGMMRLLVIVVFIPLLAAELLKRTAPATADRIRKSQYPISLLLFALTNLGVFSKYSDFFYQQPTVLVEAIAVTFASGFLFVGAGILVAWRWRLEDQLSAVISLWIMNYILVIVFSAQFFSPLEPTVAALYTFPFYAMVIPVRGWRSYRMRKHL